MSACGTCGAPIIWARTKAGRLIPLNPDAVEGGNIARVGRVDRGAMVVEVLKAGQPASLARDPLRFVSHFVDCPQAVEHRKARS